MSVENQGRDYLSEYLEEVADVLEETSVSYPKSKHIDINGLNSSEVGKILQYLADENIIDTRSRRSHGPNVYDLTDYDPQDLEELAEEELELD